MNKAINEDCTFENEDYSSQELIIQEYENCTFINCDFSKTNLSNSTFIECKFNACNLNMAILLNTSFRDVNFKECKMLGLYFENCNDFLFSVNFESCILNVSSFYKLVMKKSKFINCNLQEVDFTETDLTSTIFENCNLDRAVFNKSNLSKVDFRSAYNFSIDPEQNIMKKAVFSKFALSGLLDKYDLNIKN